MSATKFGVVYSTGNAHIRRYVYPTNDNQLVAAALCIPGEALVIVSRGPYASTAAYYAAINAAVTAAAGKAPATFTNCAVLDAQNNVTNVISADASVDTLPGFTLVQCYDPAIAVGCTYDPVAGLFTKPGFTTSAGIDRNGQPVAAVTVPSAVIAKA